MKRSIIILTVLAGVLIARVAHSAAVTVTLRQSCEVRSSQSVTLQDIAKINAPKELAQKIGEIVVGAAPMPGEQRTVDTEYVRAKLSAVNPGCAVKIVGPEKITLTGKCVRVGVDELEGEVKAFIDNQLPHDNRTYDVVIGRSPREIILPGDSKYEIKPRTFGSAIRPGANTIAIDAVVDGRTVATRSCTVEIKAVADVLVATAMISQGEAISSKNTTWEQRDVTRMCNAIFMQQGGELGDWVARRTIISGAVLTSSDLTTPAAVKSGESVTLLVKCGSVVLSTTAEAKQDGRIGDSIKVHSSVSEEDVRARVTGPGAVEINR